MKTAWHTAKKAPLRHIWTWHCLVAFVSLGTALAPGVRANPSPFAPPEPVLTLKGITANRVSNLETSGVTVSLGLSASPDVAELSAFRGLIEPLRPVSSASTEGEQAELGTAINVWLARSTSDDFSALEAFVASHPDSVWTPSLLLNLGRYFYQTGYFSKALAAWESAWKKTRSWPTPAAVDIANASVAEMAVMLARIGRKEELADLLESVSDRTFQGSTRVLIERAREGLWNMEQRPEISFKCGPCALEALHVQAHGAPQPGFLAGVDSPNTGFSLTELKDLAQSALQTSYQVAKRPAGAALVLPSVVHWGVGHYGALIREQEGAILLQDPTFANDTWMTEAAIDAEASGYFLIPAGPLPPGWSPVDDVEAATVFGKGYSSSTDNDETSPCSRQSGGGCGGGRGMAAYSFHTLLASLHITDTPAGYTSARGPDVEFTVSYNMRENGQPATMLFTSFSPLWVSRWVSYLEDNPSQPGADIRVILPGGGAETHTGYDATTQTFTKNRRWDTVLVRTGANAYERRHPDGSKEVYSQAIGTTGPARKVFMKQVVDPQGNAVTLNYDTTPDYEARILSITDATGLTSTFSYDEAGAPFLVTAIEDPFGRTATFTYGSVAGALRLVTITDIIGLESAFEYNSEGQVTAMTTPYGRTTFAFGSSNTSGAIVRWIQATDPQGDSERLEYHNRGTHTGLPEVAPASEVPVVAGVYFANYHMDDATSFYWDKKAWATAPGDFSKAHLTHWSPTTSSATASGVPHSEKPAFENRVWYRYPGQSGGLKYQGTSAQPSLIARRIEDGQDGFTTEVSRRAYNDLGNPTQIIDPAGRETTLEYATNGIDLAAVKQRVGGNLEVIRSFGYDPAFPPHRPASITDAAGQTTHGTYNTAGQILTLSNALGEVTTYTYGTHGRPTQIAGPVTGATVDLTYDGFERVRTVTDSAGHTTTYDYDAFDRVTLITYPDTTTEQFVYDRLDLHARKDREGRWTRTWHNALRQPVLTADALGRMIQFQWCKCGDLKKLIDAKGQVTFWKHDAQGRVYEKEYENGAKELLGYEPLSGRLSTVTDAMGQVKTLRYFPDGTLRSQQYANLATGTAPTADVTFSYDTNFVRLASMTDGTGTTTNTYHPIGQLGALQPSTANGPLSGQTDLITFTYDALGRIKTRNIGASGSENLVTRHYDALGRITNLVNNLGSFQFAYVDQTARPAETVYPNGQTTAFDYFPATGDHRLKTIHHKTGASTTLSRFDYTHSPGGTITSWQRQFGSAATTRYALGYDMVDQLTAATLAEAADPTAVLKRLSYQYDKAGNRISTQQDTTLTTATHNNVNELTATSGGGKLLVAGHTDELAKVTVNGKAATTETNNTYQAWIDVTPGTNTITVVAQDWSTNANTATNSWSVNVTGGTARTFTYDANGNTLTDGVRSYQWDAEDRLVKVTQGTNSWEFVYNGLSQRVAEKLNGNVTRRWILDGAEIAEQRAADSTTVEKQFYQQGEQRLGGADAGSYYYTRDHLGSIREVTDSTKALRARYDYDPYGQWEKLSGDLDCEFGFTGHFTHEATGLVLTLYRGYDARIGRWLSRDPLGEFGGINLYAYVANDPLGSVDFLGLAPVIIGVTPGAEVIRLDGTSCTARVGDVLGPDDALRTDGTGRVKMVDDKSLDGPNGQPVVNSIRDWRVPINPDIPQLGTKPYEPTGDHIRVGHNTLFRRCPNRVKETDFFQRWKGPKGLGPPMTTGISG